MNINKKFITRILAITLACLLGTGQAFGQAASRSYYVRADGNDSNNGRSEETPFKTLKKAVEMAAAGAVRTITVIGTVDGCRISGAGTQEILITGKPDASGTEKALISSEIGVYGPSKVKFTHVQITNKKGRGLSISGEVTLGVGARITNCIFHNNNGVGGGAGVYMEEGILNMTDNAVISDNTSVGLRGSGGGGVFMRNNSTTMGGSSTLNMSGNAVISGNTVENGGGGGVYVDWRGTINMSGNAAISGNNANGERGYGGGVYVHDDTILNMYGQINMSGNAAISGNIANYGGGGVVSDSPIKGGKITGNSANKGGGIMGSATKMENVEVSRNKAEYGAGVYITRGRYKNSKVTVTSGKITNNEAEFTGGGVYVAGGAVYESDKGTSVTGNRAGDGGENVFRQ
jgi:hypothetical protein